MSCDTCKNWVPMAILKTCNGDEVMFLAHCPDHANPDDWVGEDCKQYEERPCQVNTQ